MRLQLKSKQTIAIIFVIAGIAVGSLFAKTIFAAAEDRYSELQIFTKVLALIQQYYVEEVDTKKLVYGGIKGMLRELDPHTNFLPPDIYKEFENETNGEFGGIGIEISVDKGLLTVISPIEDTPAWKAGIKPGDQIVEIDGTSTKGLSLVEAAQKMRGKNGSSVTLGLLRQGSDSIIRVSLLRGVVKMKSVKYTDLGNGYAFMRITSFIESTFDDLSKALSAHEKNGPTKGLIIDLRRNPGGLLEQAIKVSNLFLDDGIIVSTIGRNKKEKEVVYAKKSGARTDFPIIILIDESSASASEIVSGALQDNHRALIMGKRSFGKGSVQSVVKLGDGSGLKMTVARYYTPSGKSIQADGIKPDVVIEDIDPEAYQKAIVKSDSKREKDIEGHLLGDEEQKAKKEKPRSLFSWIQTPDGKDSSKLTAKEKLLGSDYQALQAYNYLVAFKKIQSFDKKDSPTKSITEEKK